MRFDAPLQTGASGGHGPIRYHVSDYVPGRRVEFQFDRKGMAAGLDGRHYFEVISRRDHVLLRHVVDAECDFRTWMKWHVMIGPMHDALLEDALDRAQIVLDKAPGAIRPMESLGANSEKAGEKALRSITRKG